MKALLASVTEPAEIAGLSRDRLALIPGIGGQLSGEIHSFFHRPMGLQQSLDEARRQLEQLHRLGGRMMTILDPDYPPLLREIYDPPACLFIRGTLPPQPQPGLAVVGTRHSSTYGKACAALFSGGLAACGITIYSGLAYGIDMAAHEAALKAGGTTVAVLASGVDTVYTDPKGRLWPKIVERGALISEEWIGSELSAGKFPKRNRIISGITSGTIVIESALKGGSLITASSALEQNREVFAVPGSIFSAHSEGTNMLIQEGRAKPVMKIDDVLAEFGTMLPPSRKE
ncbi:SMF protein [Pelodictyon luteolum DSM 273]|uniref:SMF protein n=2 Tax=Pelodictyon luteolum TaxID=1100 RepID=Q3B211_CHLL3|nr:SMF protein [Pelodictyon luteolum DSM 273]